MRLSTGFREEVEDERRQDKIPPCCSPSTWCKPSCMAHDERAGQDIRSLLQVVKQGEVQIWDDAFFFPHITVTSVTSPPLISHSPKSFRILRASFLPFTRKIKPAQRCYSAPLQRQYRKPTSSSPGVAPQEIWQRGSGGSVPISCRMPRP